MLLSLGWTRLPSYQRRRKLLRALLCLGSVLSITLAGGGALEDPPNTIFHKSEVRALLGATIHVFNKYLLSPHHVPGTVCVIMMKTDVISDRHIVRL